nr:helix-hairpin-helix domain-containing protein [Flavobacterium sp. NKUCC04_CG]
MSLEEIDKLHAYREKNHFVNSAAEFQTVTGVSKQWLDSISVYFKFPQWTSSSQKAQLPKKQDAITTALEIKDINTASRDELMQVRGIGPVFSDRIINERNRLRGFVHMKQLDFIWGLSPENIANLNAYFDILDPVVVLKTNVNTATLDEISKIPYINYRIARGIVIYRSSHGDFTHLKEFENIVNFPLDKLEIISLYLAF